MVDIQSAMAEIRRGKKKIERKKKKPQGTGFCYSGPAARNILPSDLRELRDITDTKTPFTRCNRLFSQFYSRLYRVNGV